MRSDFFCKQASVSGLLRSAAFCCLIWQVGILFASCAVADTGISAFLYTDSNEEEAFIQRYNELFSNEKLDKLDLEVSRQKAVFAEEITARYHSQNLPDIFSLWDNAQFSNILQSGDLTDLSDFGEENVYRANLRNRYGKLAMLPVRYAYGNVMLINKTLLKDLKFPLQTDQIVAYEDLLNLLELTRGHSYEFLVLGKPSHLTDLFFSAVLGWIDDAWLRDYSRGLVDFDSEQLLRSAENFYGKLSALFPDPSLVNLGREQAEAMFLAGKALMIMGSSEQLLSIMKKAQEQGAQQAQQAQWDLEWLSFPQTLRREKRRETANGAAIRLRGAVQGDVLGVAMPSRVMTYDALRYNELSSVLQYYTGLYAKKQRIGKWGIPVPSSDLIVADDSSAIINKTVEFFRSINYIYDRPSLYLPKERMEFIEESSLAMLQGRKSVEAFIVGLADFAAQAQAGQAQADQGQSKNAE